MRLSDINRDVFAGDNYPWRDLFGEVVELAEALWQRDAAAVKDELEQVIFDLQHKFFCVTRVDFQPVLCGNFVKTLYRRLRVWRRIFRAHGLEFRPEFLRGGSNFRKPAKVAAALARGRNNLLSPARAAGHHKRNPRYCRDLIA